MEKNWKIIVPIAIVGLVGVAVVMSMRDVTPVEPIVPVEESIVVTPEAGNTSSLETNVSGNVDDMVNTLLNEASGDAVLVSGVVESAAAVKNDTQEVNSLTTMYDEKTF